MFGNDLFLAKHLRLDIFGNNMSIEIYALNSWRSKFVLPGMTMDSMPV